MNQLFKLKRLISSLVIIVLLICSSQLSWAQQDDDPVSSPSTIDIETISTSTTDGISTDDLTLVSNSSPSSTTTTVKSEPSGRIKANASTTTPVPEHLLPLLDMTDGKHNVITKDDLKKLVQIIKLNDKDNVIKLKKISTKINKIVEAVDENHGHIRPEMFIDEFLPDPVKVKDIPVDKSDGWFSSYTGLFSNVTMFGIRNVQIDSVKINVGKLNAKILLSISDIYLTGHYELDGSVSLVTIQGEGPFRFNISDMEIEAFGNLERSDDGKLQIGTIDLELNAEEVNLDLENFEVLGSEGIAQAIIGTLSDLIFGQVKYTVVEKASAKIQALINKRLEKINLANLVQENSEVLFDDIVSTVAKKIKHRVDPVPLPPFKRDIQAKFLQMIPINISIEVEQGKLYGLTTFARMGDIYVIYEDEHAIIEAEAGFHNLTGKYNWKLDVMGQGPSGSSSLQIRKVISYVRIRQQLKRGATPKLEEFRVKELDHVWIEMKGLGIWNHLLELIINSISNVFRLQIANLITSTVSRVLQQSLDKAQFSFIP